LKTSPERIGIVDPQSVEAGGPCRAFDGRNDGRLTGQQYFLFDALTRAMKPGKESMSAGWIYRREAVARRLRHPTGPGWLQ